MKTRSEAVGQFSHSQNNGEFCTQKKSISALYVVSETSLGKSVSHINYIKI